MWNDNDRGSRSTPRKLCPSLTSSTRPTLFRLGMNSCPHGEMPSTNHRSPGKATRKTRWIAFEPYAVTALTYVSCHYSVQVGLRKYLGKNVGFQYKRINATILFCSSNRGCICMYVADAIKDKCSVYLVYSVRCPLSTKLNLSFEYV